MIEILIFAGFGVAVLYLTNLRLHWWHYLEDFIKSAKETVKRWAR